MWQLYSLSESRIWSVLFTIVFLILEQCLAHTNCSVNIWRMIKLDLLCIKGKEIWKFMLVLQIACTWDCQIAGSLNCTWRLLDILRALLSQEIITWWNLYLNGIFKFYRKETFSSYTLGTFTLILQLCFYSLNT